MRVSVRLDAPPTGVSDRVRELAATGVDGLFTFEGRHDVFFPLVQAAGAADVELMTNIAVAFPRSPLHLAHAAYDLQLLTGGRFVLGLGSQVRAHIERRYGTSWSHPAARMRESVLAIKAILQSWETGQPPDFRGEFTRHTLMPTAFAPGPHPHGPPPIAVGALGPLMTRTAGEVADALLVMPFNSRRHIVERTLPALHDGLDRAGRDLSSIRVIGQVIAAVGRTPDEQRAADAGVRDLLAFYASTAAYRPVLEAHGWESVQPVLAGLVRDGDRAAMAGQIDDTMLATLAVRGTPGECAAAITDRFGDLADQVCCYFPGYRIPGDQLTELVSALHGGEQ